MMSTPPDGTDQPLADEAPTGDFEFLTMDETPVEAVIWRTEPNPLKSASEGERSIYWTRLRSVARARGGLPVDP